MNLAFLIGFMTFHFYLNLASHANVSTIRILIVIYFSFFGPSQRHYIASRLHAYYIKMWARVV